ncbi:MAG: rhodanese-like domain-containing protein [Mariprofundaceae bacterium]|nr:rhodanese-like domain-containing protein [Mariprofundaceae bacterium]
MDFIQQNMVSVLMAVFVLWMLWRRLIAPKLSGVRSISAVEYMNFRNQPHTLVDVRTGAEWCSGHALQALHIPLGELGRRGDEIDRNRPVVVVCASGNRSAVAATSLARNGYASVYNFAGGMGSWKGAGLPVKTGS